jgi:hypothetical protein
MDENPVSLDRDAETNLAASLLNGVWTLLENASRTPEDDLRL